MKIKLILSLFTFLFLVTGCSYFKKQDLKPVLILKIKDEFKLSSSNEIKTLFNLDSQYFEKLNTFFSNNTVIEESNLESYSFI